MIEKILDIEVKLFYFINHSRSPLLDTLLPHFSREEIIYGFYLFSLLILGYLLYQKKKSDLRKLLVIIIFLLFGFLLSDLFCGKVWKPLFKRERPFAKISKVYFYSEEKIRFLEEPLTYKKTLSFPSCHSSNSGFASAFLSFLAPTLSLPLIVFAFLVGYSRIYLGHHYPLDVLGGYLWGLVLAILSYYLYKAFTKRFFKQ